MKIMNLAIASAVVGLLTIPVTLPGQLQQPAQPSSSGEAIGVIEWEAAMGDLEKAEQFYHGFLGLESVLGDPKMRFAWWHAPPMLTELYQVAGGDLRNFYLFIPGTDMGVEPIQWSEAKGKPVPTRIQDPGSGHLILYTWNIAGILGRIAKGTPQVEVLTIGGRPVTVAAPSGKNQVVWLREPSGFFVELVQPDPPREVTASFNLPKTYYTGADVGFAVEDMDKTVRFYRDVLGFQIESSEFSSEKDQLGAFGMRGGQYRTSILRTPGNNPEIHLVEFKGIDRKPLHLHIVDPNALVLRIRVRGIDAIAAKLKAAGTKFVPLSGQPLAAGSTRWLMVQGPDNIFLQLAEAPANMPNPGAPAPPR